MNWDKVDKWFVENLWLGMMLNGIVWTVIVLFLILEHEGVV